MGTNQDLSVILFLSATKLAYVGFAIVPLESFKPQKRSNVSTVCSYYCCHFFFFIFFIRLKVCMSYVRGMDCCTLDLEYSVVSSNPVGLWRGLLDQSSISHFISINFFT